MVNSLGQPGFTFTSGKISGISSWSMMVTPLGEADFTWASLTGSEKKMAIKTILNMTKNCFILKPPFYRPPFIASGQLADPYASGKGK
jgi:hypothetical protein